MKLRPFLFALALVLASGPLAAQVLEVPGDYSDLQTALDAAPEGATIVVHGGLWYGLVIQRPVTLIGSPSFRVEGTEQTTCCAPYPPPITLEGPGHGAVVLQNAEVGGTYGGFTHGSYGPPGALGEGFDQLLILDSEVLAPQGVGGTHFGRAGIESTIPLVVVERSVVAGSDTDTERGDAVGYVAPGIDCPGTVVVLDSTVTGGDSGVFYIELYDSAIRCGAPMPQIWGGPGILHGTVYHSGSSVEGGRGARWVSERFGTLCDESPRGSAFASTAVHSLPNEIEGTGRALIGGTYALDLSASDPSVALFASFGITPGVVTSFGLAFVNPGAAISLGLHASPGRATIPVPPVPSLLGKRVTFQFVGSGGLSRPVAVVITN